MADPDDALQRAWETFRDELSKIPPERKDLAIEKLWVSKNPPSLADFLVEAPAKRRRLLEPVASFFEGAPAEASALLPYAPEDLECIVCLESLLVKALSKPPRSCTSGHLICQPCFDEIGLGKCPSCRVSLRGGPVVQLVRKLAQSAPSLCSNGCGSVLFGAFRERHLRAECPLRKVHCPECRQSVDFQDFLKHLDEHFGAQAAQPTASFSGRLREQQDLDKGERVWRDKLVKMEQASFLRVNYARLQSRELEEKLLTVNVSYYGPRGSTIILHAECRSTRLPADGNRAIASCRARIGTWSSRDIAMTVLLPSPFDACLTLSCLEGEA